MIQFLIYIGAKYIADALIINFSITVIGLGNSLIGDIGAISIAKALKKLNSAITQINLEDNLICANGAEALDDALTKNSSLRVIDLENNNLEDN